MCNQGIEEHVHCWQNDSCNFNEDIMKKNTNFSSANESLGKQI